MADRKPPLGLAYEVTHANGSRHSWGGDAPDAGSRPQGFTFRTQRGDGFADASLTLPRRIDRDYIDLALLDDFAAVGLDGSTAYEGRLGAMPRSFTSSGHDISVNFAGWMTHAKDRKFQEIYGDGDLSHFALDVSATRKADLAANAGVWRIAGTSDVETDGTGAQGVFQQLTRLAVAGVGNGLYLAEAMYDSGGVPLGSVYYDGLAVGTLGGSWTAAMLLGDTDRFAAVDSFTSAGAASAAGYLNATTATRLFALLQFYFNAATTADGMWGFNWRKLRAYGRHGLTKRGPDPGGFYVSDMVKDIATRFCPRLSTAGVQQTLYVVPHAEFIEPVFPYDAWLRLNAPHLWELAVYEGKTLNYWPVDFTDYDWEVRLSEPGVEVELQGDSSDDLANGIVVTYTDITTGRVTRLLPTNFAALTDPNVENAATKHGLTKWTEVELSSPTDQATALQIGGAVLAEFNQPKAPGTIKVRGHVRDRAGHWQQGWKVRAGDRIAITDHPNDRPRLVHETTWDHDSLTLTLAVDSTFQRIEAYFDRVSTAITAAGLVSPF